MTAPLTRTPGLAEVVHADSATVLNLPHLREQQSPYVFEGPSFAIWVRIDGTRTEAQIASEIADAFAAPVEEVTADVAEFVGTLRGLGLVGGR